MKEKLKELLREGQERISAVANETELQNVKAYFLGKKGKLTELMKELPKQAPEFRRELGKAVNQAKDALSAQCDSR